MQLSNIIDVEQIKTNINVQSKKRALEELSQLLANGQPQLNANTIFESLLSRERLGATGVGYGIAIPHGRIKNCKKISGALIKLNQAVDFNSVDNIPVDTLFALIVPEESTDEHLEVLALLAAMFKQENFRQQLREANNAEVIIQLITQWTLPS